MSDANALTALIVDDEFHARENLHMLLDEFCPGVRVIGTAGSVTEAREKITSLQPQVVFLDIRMPSGAEGFDLLESIPEKKFQVVFVTAFKDYAIQAFNANAIHYILKPIDIDDLQVAVKKLLDYDESFRNQSGSFSKYLDSVKTLTHLVKSQGKAKRLTLYHSKGFRVVETKDIIRLEADGNCTQIYFSDGTKYLDTKTLKIFEDMLDDEIFFRVHKSHLINLTYLKEYLNTDGGEVVMKDGATVPVARNRLSEFLAKIKS